MAQAKERRKEAWCRNLPVGTLQEIAERDVRLAIAERIPIHHGGVQRQARPWRGRGDPPLGTLRAPIGAYLPVAGVPIKPRRVVHPDDALTPAETEKLRHALKQVRAGKTRPWSEIKTWHSPVGGLCSARLGAD